MDAREVYGRLLEWSRETSYMRSAGELLGWDQRTQIPPKGHAHRAGQLAALARFVHRRATDPWFGEALSEVEAAGTYGDPLSAEAVNLREWRWAYDRSVKVPERLAVELARATAEGETAWELARPRNDWAGFSPHLSRIVALKREEAQALGYEREPYDALLEDFEPGETAANLELVFATLRRDLTALLRRIEGAPRKPDTTVLGRHFPKIAQEAFVREVVAALGYDFSAGRLDPTAHPFSTGIGPGDVRITTRYFEDNLAPALFGGVHEAGHGMYDQGLPTGEWGAPAGDSVSLGVHESQSRLWENLVGRSLGFWRHFFPRAREVFPALRDVSCEAFHFAVNAVRPSLIRIEADEVTYNLHILLRLELELALIRGDLAVPDLPGAWNERMEALLGVAPPDFASGVMQDVHWSAGLIGYFPTYTLGNLISAQLFEAAARDLGDMDALCARGDFAALLSWLREKVHSQGRRYRSRELVRHATGADLDPGCLVRALHTKFSALYGF